MSFSPLTSLLEPDVSRSGGPSGDGRHYDPGQPRVPAGQPGGGQWTRIGALLDGTTGRMAGSIEDAPLRKAEPIRLAQAAGRASDANTNTLSGPLIFNKPALDAATWVFRRRVDQAKDGELPVFEFKAREFQSTGEKTLDLANVRTLEREEAQRRCSLTSEIQKLIDKSVNEVRKDAGASAMTPQLFGTRAHKELEGRVEELAKAIRQGAAERGLPVEVNETPTIEDLGAEHSLNRRGGPAEYGERDSVRLDVTYRQGRTACVGDLKTGKRGLSGPRAAQLAVREKARHKNAIDDVLVMEMRVDEN
jgi:hypothetical protein